MFWNSFWSKEYFPTRATACPRCGEKIQGQHFSRYEEDSHTVRADGKRDRHYSKVSICKKCHHAEKEAKAEVMARNAVILILGACALYWLPFENIEGLGQKIVAVMAPKDPAPRIITPENNGSSAQCCPSSDECRRRRTRL
jgi:hypothetical protein